MRPHLFTKRTFTIVVCALICLDKSHSARPWQQLPVLVTTGSRYTRGIMHEAAHADGTQPWRMARWPWRLLPRVAAHSGLSAAACVQRASGPCLLGRVQRAQ